MSQPHLVLVRSSEAPHWQAPGPRDSWQRPARPPATLNSSTRGLKALLALAVLLLIGVFFPGGADRTDLSQPDKHPASTSPCSGWGPAPAGYSNLKGLVLHIPGAPDHDWRAIRDEIEKRNGTSDPSRLKKTPSSCTG